MPKINSTSKPKLVTLYHHFACNDHGENEGIFDAKGNLLGAWSSNDATYSWEYMNPFMEKLGFVVKDLPDKMIEKGERAIAESLGCVYEDEEGEGED